MNAPLSPQHLDALTEIVNIGVGRAANVLNEMVGSPIQLKVPSVKVVDPAGILDELRSHIGLRAACVNMPFQGSLTGLASMVFPPESAVKLVSLLTGEEITGVEMDSLMVETLNEISNIVINSVIGQISNMMRQKIYYSIPTFHGGKVEDILTHSLYKNGRIIIANAEFQVKAHNIQGNIMLVFEIASFESLISAIASEIQ
ncbi:MAG: chemotaxis protein CheX [Nitrospinae bacterium]|nr:chemotaxis protein CheX [Nitrospinota bacterium]